MRRLALTILLLAPPAAYLAHAQNGPAQANLPTEEATPKFSREVAAVFSRLGCNSGTCHGAVNGQNGFRLSLFAADPELDHARIRRELGGRRLNLFAPEASLLLTKATGQLRHGGGKRTEVGSTEYELLLRWIAGGAALDPVERSRLKRLEVTPSLFTATLRGEGKEPESYRLRVQATFVDGSVLDVTSLCSYESLDRQVASVDAHGQVQIKATGDTALMVRFRTEPAVALVVVPRGGADLLPKVSANNFIDRHILAKLEKMNLPAAPLADDVTFLRRIFLDVTGELPGPEEVRAFLADKTVDKRARKIDELLARPGYAAVWALKFCDLLNANDYGVYADGLTQEHDAPRFQQWVRARLEENMPYDQFVERILTATSREGRSLEEWGKEVSAISDGYTTPRLDLGLYSKRKTPDLYWQRRGSGGVSGALQVAHSFLGLRLECAQCHRHPHDVWQQQDLLSFANFFMSVRQPGFQGDNEKKYADVAAYVNKLNAEAKKLTEDVKKLRDGRGKELDAEAKKTKSKEVVAAFKKFQEDVGAMDRRSKSLPEVGRRMLHAEVAHLSTSKEPFAKVTSPLGSQESRKFRLLGDGKDLDVGKDQDPRLLVAAWMRRPDNPFFARAIVNRVWAHYLGRGIVDPPDHLSPLNPPTHPELLAELSSEFIKHGYDLKWLHRAILNSRTYQQSSVAPPASALDRSNYASFYLRRLPAEVLIDALSQATGVAEDMEMKYYNWPADWKALEIPFTPKNAFVSFMLEQFGRPQRNSGVQCDCERDSNASVLQVLSVANHPRIRQKIADDKGQIAKIMKAHAAAERRIEEIFLCTLSRLPSDAELQACLEYVRDAMSPVEGMRGVMWSLLNTREFLFQH